MIRNRRVLQFAGGTKCVLAILFIITSGLAALGQKAEPGNPQKAKVLVLATYHLHNPGRDVLNVKWDDVLTEKRQKEIRELADAIKKFKPTKIALEVPFGSAKLDEQYGQYLRGEYQLTPNEIDQLGFRIAKDLGHQKVYGVDASGAFDIGRVFAFAASNDQQQIVDKALEVAKRQVADANNMIKTADVTAVYRATNDQRKIDEGHQV